MRLPDRVLEPGERISEILFGLIMALTVTGTTSVVTADRFQIRTMLIAALGCNVAWGIIDAGMYLMARLIERGSNALLLREIREAPDNQTAHSCRAAAMGNGPYNGSHRHLPGGHCDSTRRMKFANSHQVTE
jgi:hypothetical protein